jgi:hypothetical protein
MGLLAGLRHPMFLLPAGSMDHSSLPEQQGLAESGLVREGRHSRKLNSARERAEIQVQTCERAEAQMWCIKLFSRKSRQSQYSRKPESLQITKDYFEQIADLLPRILFHGGKIDC